MIIGNDFVYIHVCKTGGSSFEEMMEQRHGIKTTLGQHSIAAEIPAEERGKFIFGIMRDPLWAEVSNWRYHWFSWGHPKSMTFENWCRYRFTDDAEIGNTFEVTEHQREYARIFNVKPSAGFFCDWDGHCIADRIYRYENLGMALDDISDRLNLNCKIDGFSGMEYNWGRGREDYSQHVTDKARELVEEYKAIDFMLHRAPGPISTSYTCPVSPKYCYSR